MDLGDYTKVYIEDERQETSQGKVRESCNQCYIKRQSSQEYSKDRKLFLHQDIDMADSYHIADERDGTRNPPTESENSNNRNKTAHQLPVVESHKSSFFEREKSVYPSVRRLSTTSVERFKKSSCCFSNAKCSCLLSVFAAVCSLLVLIYVVYNDNIIPVEVSQVENDVTKTEALQASTDSEKKIAGRFKLESPFLENGSFLWVPVDAKNNLITVYNSCLVVPEEGTYAVFSFITFRIFKEDTVSSLGHYLRLHSAQENEQTFQRRIRSVPAKDNRGSPEFIPSSLVSFVEMKAGGKICVDASHNGTYVYHSTFDNSINIFKL